MVYSLIKTILNIYIYIYIYIYTLHTHMVLMLHVFSYNKSLNH